MAPSLDTDSRSLAPPQSTGPNRISAKRKKQHAQSMISALFLAPSAVFLALFLLVPTAEAFRLALHKWNGLSPEMEFVGLDTFVETLSDSRLAASLVLTVVFWVMHLVLAVGGGLLLATLLARVARGLAVFRTLFFLPHVLSLSVVGIVWSQIYHPTIGLLNEFLTSIGLEFLAQAWLGIGSTALPAVSVASGWQAYGFYMVIYLAAIQGIDTQLYEAAKVDGANFLQEFRNVTLPGLHNATTVVLILAFISALKGFGSVWAMTQGGPGTSTEIIAVYLYRQAFQYGEVSQAAAGGLLLGAFVIIVTMAFNRWRDSKST